MVEYPHILAQNQLATNSSVTCYDGTGKELVQDPIYRISHLYDLSRLSLWKGHDSPAALAEQRLVFRFASAVECDTLVLDRNFTLSGGSLYLEYTKKEEEEKPEKEMIWTSAADLLSMNPNAIYWCRFPSPTTSISSKYWRIRLTNLAARPQIYNLWLGKRIELTFGPMGDFDPYEEELVGEGVHGAAGGFTWTHRYRRRVLSARFENLTDTQYRLIDNWWTQAGRDGKNWWWLTWPESEKHDPLYLNCEGQSKRFPLSTTVRGGTIEAYEVK